MSSNQRFIMILATMMLAGVALMRVSPVNGKQTTSQVADKVIRAKRIEIVDDSGSVRMVLGEFPGVTRIQRGGAIVVNGDAIHQKITDTGSPLPQMGLMVKDKKGTARLLLSVGSDQYEGPALRLLDQSGQQRTALRFGGHSYNDDGDVPHSTLEFYGTHWQEARPTLALTGDDEGRLTLSDSKDDQFDVLPTGLHTADGRIRLP